MKMLFDNLRRRKEKWILHTADLTEQIKPLRNPARGWYQIYTFSVEQEPDFKELAYSIEAGHSLAMVFLDIGYYRLMDIDASGMSNIRNILRFFAENHKDIILRAAYDNQGKALEREPESFEQVLRHMSQLGEILSEFQYEVFIYQGLLVGNWGEMHTSHFLSGENLRLLMDILYKSKGKGTYPAVRRPVYWRILQHNRKYEGLGLFDDGIFGSSSNLGTFGTYTKDAAGRDEAWSREEELDFEEELCRRTPNGGEAVYGEDYTDGLSAERMIRDLRRMHVSYLNSRHDTVILDMWKRIRPGVQGLWSERPLYDYIDAHMGYRFHVKNASLALSGNERRNLYRLELLIENIGFGNLYQESELYVEWTDENEHFKRQRIDCDMREWDSGREYVVSCIIKGCESTLYLSAKRKWDGAAIRFANMSDDAGRTIIGSLCGQTL